MKTFYKTLASVFLCILFGVITSFAQSSNTEQANESLILSKDYWKALNSSKESVKNKNKDNLKLCLQSQFFDIKTECVKALVDLEDKEILEKLIEMLKNNQIPQRSTEGNIERKEFNFVLIALIEKTTGLKLLITDELNVKEINRILRESRKWLASYKGVKFDEDQPDEVTASDELLDYKSCTGCKKFSVNLFIPYIWIYTKFLTISLLKVV